MKILIMVLSYNEPPYDSLMKMQQATFDSIEVEGVRTVYYHGGLNQPDPDNRSQPRLIHIADNWYRVELNCTDDYYYMSEKFKRALDYVKDWDYDIIFRTNSSSYVNKQRLKEFAATLPPEKLYAGCTFNDSNSEDKGMCVSGAGIWLSRDCAEILRNEIDNEFEMEEDVYCGRILRKNGIVPITYNNRFDVPMSISPKEIPLDRCHYRFKTTQNRLADIGNMKMLHKLISFYDNHKPIGELIKL